MGDGERFKRERLVLGMTQVQAAALCQRSVTTLSLWENGRQAVEPMAFVVLRLWRALPERQRVRVLADLRPASKKPPA